ncbi:MAG: peptidoglycan-binding domain-containing protein, partial [Rhodospirillales bacterium]
MHRLVQDYLIYVALAVGVFFGTSETVLAARSTFSPKSSGHLTVTPIPESMISKIQTALRKIGIYRGPIDGRVNNETKQAVRKYQKMHGLKVNGNISKSLANLLDTGSRVDTLLKQIDRARKNNIQTACEALLNNPETKHLLKDNSDDRANPVRDSKSCFKKPPAKCLLFEAAESAKSIYKKEMRDWALGELLVAQTMAGLINEAMITTRRIHDPRLIVVALRNIAEAQAIARRDEEALAATKIIPDPLGRSEAYTAIAEIQAKHKGDGNDLILLTIKLLHSDLKKIKDPLKQLYFLTRAATALSNTGHQKKAQLYLQEASELAKHKLSARTYQTALRYIAIAFADLGLPNEALALLK